MKSSSKRRIRPIQARAATVDPSTMEDYGPEPNMKLSHAFIVVLALHVIAVGGLFAFNKVKAHHGLSSVKIKTESTLESSAEGASKTTPPISSGVEKNAIAVHQTATTTPPIHAVGTDIAPNTTPTAAPLDASTSSGGNTPPPAPPQTPSTPPTPSVATSAPESSSKEAPEVASKEYTVVKGDNPYKIAKRFHVSYDSLIKLNNITDPRKIQIGQKLKIPAAVAKKTTKHHQ